MKKQDILSVIEAIGFTVTDNSSEIYEWLNNKFKYSVQVDFNKQKIDFGLEIQRADETTSHLQNPENLVVLECVCRLINKGYKPKDLILENKWRLGRTTKSGKADITIKDKNGKTLLIIECKTWGKEFEKEKNNMKTSGGQLISYFQQDKNTRYLCLYTSRFHLSQIEYKNSILKVEDSVNEKLAQQESTSIITYSQARTVKELVDVWKVKTKNKQTYLHTGIFELEIEPYNPGYVPVKIKDLCDFGRDDKGKVFNQFEEILRHNNISDRSNAFNRFISLVLAKIVDETKGPDEIADFQVKEGIDDGESLLERLQALYSKAMKDFLKEDVINYKLEDIEKEIANFPRQTAKETLYQIYKELKFYQNNEFAFKEVYNRNLFEENAKVLEEIVRLFQNFRFKYDRKAQFLGDFFELMLEDGYRQSEGQYFTPTPITKFMVSSLPIHDLIEKRIAKDEKNLLPYVVDYACGSGHFLTEAIDEIITVLKEMDNERKIPDKSKEILLNTKWSGEYIYGIEKDYRLARTSQVACYMHGDGDVNIIFGDGLAKHTRLLKDGLCDILIANPPYTIDNFKPHLRINTSDFTLWNEIPDTSDDIEVLFVERMKQLLKVRGLGSIILPQSILNSGGIFSKARTLLLESFEFVSIVELGGSTFGETGTKTFILFLRRRDDNIAKNCKYIAEDFILKQNLRDGDFIDSINTLVEYSEILGFTFDDYVSLIEKKPSFAIIESDLYKDYTTWFAELSEVKKLKEKKFFTELTGEEQKKYIDNLFFEAVLNIEFDKFYHFLLTQRISNDQNKIGKFITGDKIEINYPIYSFENQNVLIVSTGKKDSEQKDFLGYKFSKRRGGKGIDIFEKNSLFDLMNRMSDEKVNFYIRNNYLTNREVHIHKDLSANLNFISLSDCVEFDKIDFDATINISGVVKIDYEGIWNTQELVPLRKFTEVEKGSSITKARTISGPVPVIAGGREPAYYHNICNREANVITVSASGAYSGFVNYWSVKIFASDCSTIRSLNENDYPTQLIYYYLKHIQGEIYRLQRGSGQPHVYPKDIKKIKLPVLIKGLGKKKLIEISRIEKNRSKYLKPNMKLEEVNNVISVEISKILLKDI